MEDEYLVSCLLQDETRFPSAVSHLIQDGVAIIRLPTELECIPSRAFHNFRRVLREMDVDRHRRGVTVLPNDTDSAHATGYHHLGGLSRRYNRYRRGFIFSDGNECVVDTMFRDTTRRLFQLLHAIFQQTISALEDALGLPTKWFQNQLGPTVSHSQWHLKEYIDTLSSASSSSSSSSPPSPPSSENEIRKQDNDGDDNDNDNNSNDDLSTIRLGTHTDPSLLSVIIHDRPGVQDDSFGLQYRKASKGQSSRGVEDPSADRWNHITATGHGIAVIMVGSVMAAISANQIPACRHRVVKGFNNSNNTIHRNDGNDHDRVDAVVPTRVAATLFGRPAPNALLQTLPCPRWSQSIPVHTKNKKTPITFEAWNARVARKYEKSKRNKKNK